MANLQQSSMMNSTLVMLNSISMNQDFPLICNHLAQILDGKQIHQGKAALRAMAESSPTFAENIIQVMTNNQDPPTRLVASTFLGHLIEKKIESVPDPAQFNTVVQILENDKIQLVCRLSFGGCIRAIIRQGIQGVTVDDLVNLTLRLFQGSVAQKILAVFVLESFTHAQSHQSSFVVYLNAVMIPMAKKLLPCVSAQNVQLLLRWAKALILIFDRLHASQIQEGTSGSAMDMLSYMSSGESIAHVIFQSYNTEGSDEGLDQMRGSMGMLHHKVISQVLKEDTSSSGIQFKVLEQCIPTFCQFISKPKLQQDQEFATSILGILANCATHNYFRCFFQSHYQSIVHSLIPLLCMNEQDLYYFQDEPQEFVASLDDLCQDRASQTLKCRAAELLVSLVTNIDGTATYVFGAAVDTLKNRLGILVLERNNNLTMQVDEAFLVLAIISDTFESRDDFREELRSVLSDSKLILAKLTELELGLLYFFLSFSLYQLLGDETHRDDYLISACNYQGHNTVKFLALDFLIYQLQFTHDVSMFTPLTARLLTQDLTKYQDIYSKYLKRVFKMLSEDDLITFVTILISRIDQENTKVVNKTSQNIFMALKIFQVVSSKHHLLILDVKLREKMKDVLKFIDDKHSLFLSDVIKIFNQVLFSQFRILPRDFGYLPQLKSIVEHLGNVRSTFYTLCLFISKSDSKQPWATLFPLLQLATVACRPQGKDSTPDDVGRGLLLLQLFVGRFGAVIPEQVKRELLGFLPRIALMDSDVLKTSLINVYLKLYPQFISIEFKNSLMESIQQNQQLFTGYERRSLIEGVSQLLVLENDPALIQQLVFVATRQLKLFMAQSEQVKDSPKKSKSKQSKKDKKASLQASTTAMLSCLPDKDVFTQFRQSFIFMSQSNNPAFKEAVKQFPEYLVAVLNDIITIKQVQSKPRKILKVKSVKDCPVLSEGSDSEEGTLQISRKVFKRQRGAI